MDHLDWLLQRLEIHWNDVEEAGREWDEWEEHERLDFVLEWPIAQSHWEVLHRYLDGYELTSEQRNRYRSLVAKMERLHPTLNRLLDDEAH